VSAAIATLVGPLPALGSPATVANLGSYDTTQLNSGTIYAEQFPWAPSDLVSSNYYDLALTLYAAYYRTGDAYWLNKARYVASTWRDSPNNQNIVKYLGGDYSVGSTIPPGRSMSTLGLAVLAIENNDASARNIVNQQARLVEQVWGVTNWSDAREKGYELMALVASNLLGDGHLTSARTALDTILSYQNPAGYWDGTSSLCPAGPFVNNFMDAILAEALVLYDRVIGDPRIVPALQSWAAWEWNTQWLPGSLSFQYSNVNDTNCGTVPATDLNGLFLPAWGYLYSKTGDTTYKTQGAQIFSGVVSALNVITSEKHYAQFYRSSGRYLGFVAQMP
jgi:hypothetical protein